MTQRESHQLWLKDIIEHLRERQDQLDWTEDPESARLLLEEMIRDLDCGKLVCEAIKRFANSPNARPGRAHAKRQEQSGRAW